MRHLREEAPEYTSAHEIYLSDLRNGERYTLLRSAEERIRELSQSIHDAWLAGESLFLLRAFFSTVEVLGRGSKKERKATLRKVSEVAKELLQRT